MVLRLENNLRTALLLVAIAVMAIVSTSKLFGQGVKPPKSKAWSFVFRVVDEDGAQLKDATVETKADDTSDSHQQLPNGDFQIEGYSTPNQLVLRCQSEGKSPIKVQWLNFYDIPDSSAAKPFLVTLPTAKAIGGKVVDRQGDAIEGATVFVWVPSAGQRLQLEISDFPCKTDAQGKWSCPVAPADLRRVRIRLQHPDYHSDQRYDQTVKDVSIEDVQAHDHVAVMRKGATVNGKVTGPDGQPVANADVYQGTDRLGTEYPKTKTDQEGNFVFTNCQRGSMVLTVVAKDFAPELVQIAVGKDLPKSVELKLDRGKRLAIQVVDSHGDPIPEAEIVIRGWKDHSSLYDTNLPSRADKDGLFVWENAPKEAVKCDVRASGFEKHGWVDFTADDEPVVVKLFRPLIARGSVIDGKTNKPIERFTMISQHHDTSGRVSAKQLTTIEGKDGRYELNFPEPRGTHSIRIKVDGYAPQTSAVFQRGQGEVTFDFKLSQSFGVEGKVVSPDGLPVVGATVALTEKKFQTVRLNDGRIENLDDFVTDSTGTDGDFYLISPKKAWKVYVCHELGFARINGTFFETGHELKLSPWASIKGNDLKSYEDETSVEIKLVGVEKADLRLKQQTTTNSDGEYEIPKVVPGIQYVVERRVTNLDSDRQFKQPRQVTSRINLAAGAHVLLGQSGRKVVGKLTFEGWRLKCNGYAKAKARLPRYPKGFDDWDVARQRKWKSNWSKTEAGIRYHTSRSLEYPLKFEGDRGTGEASFEIEALPPGFYEVAIELDTSLGESSKKTLKLHVKKIAVEERDPQPQNMGVIEFKTSFGD